MEKSNIFILPANVVGNKLALPVKFITFSDGSETCQLDEYLVGDVIVDVRVETVNRDLVRIGLVKDALDRMEKVNRVELFMPYMPQARADRKFSDGMPLPLKVFTSILNSFKFDLVTVIDPHSDVTSALIDNVAVIQQHEAFNSYEFSEQIKKFLMYKPLIVSPDIGASKKIYDLAKSLESPEFVQALKIRDVLTGAIVKCEVQCEDLKGRNVLIADDISDGGASFLHLAKLLKKEHNAGDVMLYVSHGIFSKGLEPFKGVIDLIVINNIVGNYINKHEVDQFNYLSFMSKQ